MSAFCAQSVGEKIAPDTALYFLSCSLCCAQRTRYRHTRGGKREPLCFSRPSGPQRHRRRMPVRKNVPHEQIKLVCMRRVMPFDDFSGRRKDTFYDKTVTNHRAKHWRRAGAGRPQQRSRITLRSQAHATIGTQARGRREPGQKPRPPPRARARDRDSSEEA